MMGKSKRRISSPVETEAEAAPIEAGEKIELQREQAADKKDDNDVPNPVILQCGSCKNIIGDTLSLAFIDPTIKLASLHDVSDFVSVSRTKSISKDGFDKGCKWLQLKCTNCKAFLGKKYVEIEPGTNLSSELLDVFTFHDDNIATYQVGCLKRSIVQNEDICERPGKSVEVPISSNKMSEEMVSVINKNKNDLSMVKYTIIGLMDRIHELENKLASTPILG